MQIYSRLQLKLQVNKRKLQTFSGNFVFQVIVGEFFFGSTFLCNSGLAQY